MNHFIKIILNIVLFSNGIWYVIFSNMVYEIIIFSLLNVTQSKVPVSKVFVDLSNTVFQLNVT